MIERIHSERRSRHDLHTAAGYVVIIAVWLMMAL